MERNAFYGEVDKNLTICKNKDKIFCRTSIKMICQVGKNGQYNDKGRKFDRK